MPLPQVLHRLEIIDEDDWFKSDANGEGGKFVKWVVSLGVNGLFIEEVWENPTEKWGNTESVGLSPTASIKMIKWLEEITE